MTILCIGQEANTLSTAGLKLVLRNKIAEPHGFSGHIVEAASVLAREATTAAAEAVTIDLLVYTPPIPQVPAGPINPGNQQAFLQDMLDKNVPVILLYQGPDTTPAANRARYFFDVCYRQPMLLNNQTLLNKAQQAEIASWMHEKRAQRLRDNVQSIQAAARPDPHASRPTHLRLVR